MPSKDHGLDTSGSRDYQRVQVVGRFEADVLILGLELLEGPAQSL
jgi:hypothetical protein